MEKRDKKRKRPWPQDNFSNLKAIKATEDVQIAKPATCIFSTDKLHSIFLQPHSDGYLDSSKLSKEPYTAKISMIHGTAMGIVSTLPVERLAAAVEQEMTSMSEEEEAMLQILPNKHTKPKTKISKDFQGQGKSESQRQL